MTQKYFNFHKKFVCFHKKFVCFKKILGCAGVLKTPTHATEEKQGKQQRGGYPDSGLIRYPYRGRGPARLSVRLKLEAQARSARKTPRQNRRAISY